MKDTARLNAHRAGQIAHRGALVALAAKQVRRGLQQFAAGAFRVGHLSTGHQFAHYRLGLLIIHAQSPTLFLLELDAQASDYPPTPGNFAQVLVVIVKFMPHRATKQALGHAPQKIFTRRL
ncbi:hypothetical protein D3C71_1620280 [compost metagenome]